MMRVFIAIAFVFLAGCSGRSAAKEQFRTEVLAFAELVDTECKTLLAPTNDAAFEASALKVHSAFEKLRNTPASVFDSAQLDKVITAIDRQFTFAVDVRKVSRTSIPLSSVDNLQMNAAAARDIVNGIPVVTK